MKLSILAAAGVCVLAAAGSAGAAAKERVVVDRFSEPYEFAVDCGDFGPYDFEILASGTQHVQVTDVFAADGTLLQTVFRIRLTEIGTNSETGLALPLRSVVHEVWEYGDNTRTLSGSVWMGTERGAGTYVHDSGRITMTLDDREPLFLAGPKEVFFGGGLDEVVCAALDEA